MQLIRIKRGRRRSEVLSSHIDYNDRRKVPRPAERRAQDDMWKTESLAEDLARYFTTMLTILPGT